MLKPVIFVACLLSSLGPIAVLAQAPADMIYATGFEGPGRIEFVTDQSALVTAEGQSFDFEVRVFDRNGVETPDALVHWYPENDELVSVEILGDRTARVTSTGFALGNLPIRVVSPVVAARAEAQVVFADLKPGVYSFSSDQVTSVDRSTAPNGPYTVVLPRNAITETISASDVVISGDRAGLLDRVLSVDIGASEVTLTTEIASLEDVFENLSYSASTPLVVGSSEDPGALPPGRQVLQGIDSAECKTENNSNAGLTTTGATVAITHYLELEVSVSIVGGSLQSFELGPMASANVTGESGSLEWSSQVAGEVTCALELNTFKTPSLPVHMFSFQLGVTPEIGVKAGASFDGPSFTITGPKGAVSGGARGGIAWAPGGWSTYGMADWDGSFDPFEGEFDSDIEFELTAKPYAMLGFSAIANLGRPPLGLSLAEVNFADIEGGLPGELGLASPFQVENPDYAGPSWKIEAKLEGALKAELSGGALQDLLNALSIPTSIDLNDADLWEPIVIELASSPSAMFSADCEPNCTLDPSLNESTLLTLNIVDDSTASGQASFFTAQDGAATLTEIANGSVSGGSGNASWMPSVSDEGNHDVYARYSIDLLSQAFPYAVTDPVGIVVGTVCDGGTQCLAPVTGINDDEGAGPMHTGEEIAIRWDTLSPCRVLAGEHQAGDDPDYVIVMDSDIEKHEGDDVESWDDTGTGTNWGRSPADFGENNPPGSYTASLVRGGARGTEGATTTYELDFTVEVMSISATVTHITVRDVTICPVSEP